MRMKYPCRLRNETGTAISNGIIFLFTRSPSRHKRSMNQHKQRDDASKPVDENSAESMQEANATGARQNEQGRASFITGTTTGGGSNHGQGSSHLGTDSYRQGDTRNAGSNYSNESYGLGDSSVGTSEEGTSGTATGDRDIAQVSDTPDHTEAPAPDASPDRGPGREENETPAEGERRDVLPPQEKTAGPSRNESGAWSKRSTDEA